MTRKLIAILLVLGLAACNRNASDQPESTTDAAPSDATPSETTAVTTPPSANDSANATTSTTGTTTDSTMASEGEYGAMGEETLGADTSAAAAGGSTLGASGTDAMLDDELRRCDTMSGTERTSCRSEAQTRYDQRSRDAGDSVTP